MDGSEGRRQGVLVDAERSDIYRQIEKGEKGIEMRRNRTDNCID